MMELKKYKLGEIAEINKSSLGINDDIANIIYLDTANITENKIDNLQYIELDKAPSRAKRKVKHNTIIFSTVRPNLKHFGILKNPTENFIVSTGFATIDCNDSIVDPDYLYCYLIQEWIINHLQTIAENSVSSYPSINPSELENLELSLPSLATQKRISSVLSNLDNLISLKREENSTLEAMAKEIYDYWFVQFDFPDQNGKPYKTSGGKMVYNDVLKREIPEGWEAGKLGDISNITMGQSPDGSSYNEMGNGSIFYQGCSDFGDRFPSIRKYTTAPTRFAQKGDILMSVRAPVGDLNIANNDCCIGRGLASLNSKVGSITHLYFVLKNLKQTFEQRNGTGTTFGSINKDDLHSLLICKSPVSVLNTFESICKPIFEKQMLIGNQIQTLTALRDYLLPLLMNGQVEVKEAEEKVKKLYGEMTMAAEPEEVFGK